MVDKTIENLRFITKQMDSNVVRIWRVIHEAGYKDEEWCSHWYQLINDESVNPNREWPEWPLGQELFDELISGVHKDHNLIFGDVEALVFTLKHGV